MFWAREHHGNGRTEVECYFCVFFSSSSAWRFRIVVWNPEFMLPGMFVLPIIPLDHAVGVAEFQHLLPRAAMGCLARRMPTATRRSMRAWTPAAIISR